jgi:pentatricopeptide repeat protein
MCAFSISKVYLLKNKFGKSIEFPSYLAYYSRGISPLYLKNFLTIIPKFWTFRTFFIGSKLNAYVKREHVNLVQIQVKDLFENKQTKEIIRIYQDLKMQTKELLNLETIRMVMKAHVFEHRFKEAAQLVRHLFELGCDARSAAQELRSAGLSLFPTGSIRIPVEPGRFETYPSPLDGLLMEMGEQGALRVDKSFWIYDVMRELGVPDNIMIQCKLMEAFLRKKEPEKAIQLFLSIPQPKSMISYNLLIQAYLKMDNMFMAIKTLRDMSSVVIDINSTTYISFLNKYARDLNIGKAFQILAAMDRFGFNVPLESFNLLIAACGKLRRMNDAIQLFNRMKQRNVDYTEETVLEMIHVCRNCGETQMELELWKKKRELVLKALEGIPSRKEIL